MTTKLSSDVRREVLIAREPWVVTITPTTLKLTRKGKRKGIELAWESLVNGDAALAAALNASAEPKARQARAAAQAARERRAKKSPVVGPHRSATRAFKLRRT
jgi:hypothetical protein